jgi:peptidoglycan/xylan/chitin deacetylase (PgdA/CDA1 family)
LGSIVISQRIKSAARSLAGGAYKASPGFLAHLRGRALILMYHRVIARSEASSDFVQPSLYVAPDTFDRHLDFLTANFRIISLRDLRSQWVRGTLDPALRYCVITFDDGWRDNYVHAYPLLRAYGAPATIFLPTSFIGTEDRLWFDRLGAALRGTRPDAEIDALIERAKTMTHDDRRQLVADSEGKRARSSTRRFITWDQAREMSTHGISFGSHTCSHPSIWTVSFASRSHGCVTSAWTTNRC